MVHVAYLAAAVLIGACLSLQPPINSVMARTLGDPLLAAASSITISLVVALGAWLLWSRGAGDLTRARSLPWWVIAGGVVGVVFVAGGVVVAPRVGMALFFVCVVTGQLAASTLVDHLGAFGTAVKPIHATKLLGLGLVLAGALLVQKSDEGEATSRSPTRPPPAAR